MEVEAAADGLLVLTDTYAPGWKALLDGHLTSLYVADHAFRAVLVPDGIHQVEFVYEPASFWVGMVLSLLTIAILIPALLLFRMRQART
jgi:uncharacterized membrane protein YfhO